MQTNNFLLVIGIDKYNTPTFQPLNNAVSDAKQLIKILEEKYNFQKQEYLFDENATRENIINGLNELSNTVLEDDHVIIFFAGHGWEDPTNKLGYIIPYNAQNRASFVSFNEVKNDYINFLKAKHILVIFDCCYATNFISRTRGTNFGNSSSYDKRQLLSSRYFLASGGEEPVLDGKGKPNSPFMNYLLRFLEDNTKKNFAITELGVFLKENVGNVCKQQPICEPIQDLEGHTKGGEFIFTLESDFGVEKSNTIIENHQNIVPEIKETFATYLEDAGAKYLHSKKDDITLSDIFVEPNLKATNIEHIKGQNLKVDKLWNIVDTRNDKNQIKLVIIGSETSGKTTICKRIFDRYYQEGYFPILLNGKDDIREIRKEKFLLDTKKAFSNQYQNFDFDKIDNSKIILIIDDFHKFKPTKNKDFRDVLIKNINSGFQNIILIGDTLMPLEVMTKDRKLKNIFDDYSVYQIIEFGSKLRHELIEKWYCIGQEREFIDRNELLRWYDEREQQVKSIIGKNYMPAYPFYILTIIQILESSNKKPEYSLHGFYYQHLIDQQLNEAVKNKEDISLYYNYITEFAFHLFETKQSSTSISTFEQFHNLYSKKYAITYSYINILKNLQEAKMLEVNGNVRIQYKYIYYFFVAKYLTNNLSKSDIRDTVSKMCKRLYREEYANIIMFLTHLTKEPFIIQEILGNAKKIFSENRVSELNKDIDGINSLIKNVPNQVIELVKAEDIRNEELEEKEEVEMLEREYENSKQDVSDYDLNESLESINLISKITLSLKTIEILGQLVKKYWGSMDKDEKYAIAEETYFLGLRTLNNYLTFVQDNADMIAEIVKELVLKKNIKNEFSLKKTAEDTTNDFIFRLCFLSSFGVVKRISNAIGYPKLYQILDEVVEKNPKNSIKLIDLSIHLDYEGRIPIDRIKSLNQELGSNKICTLILRNLVLERLYYFDEDYKDMNRISGILGIPIQQQRYINATSKVKKE
jgi:GTPase SAR1 family protein